MSIKSVTKEETSKFSVGDRVVSKRSLSSFGREVGRAEVEKIYIVRAINEYLPMLFYVEGVYGYLDEDDFELAECIWTQEENELARNRWHTACGKTVQYLDRFPSENGYVFCPHCGIPILAKETEMAPAAGTKVRCVNQDRVFDLWVRVGDVLTVKSYNSECNTFFSKENEGIWLFSCFEIVKEDKR